MKAKARTEGMIVTESCKGLIVHDAEHDLRHELPPLAALVWRHADGRTGIARLVALVREHLLPTANEETVWAALDDLADAGLLEERLTPPGAPVSRRDALRNVGSGIAAGLIATVMGAGVADAASRRNALRSRVRREKNFKSRFKQEKSRKSVAKKTAPRLSAERDKKAVAEQTVGTNVRSLQEKTNKQPLAQGTVTDRAARVRRERARKRKLKKQISSIRQEEQTKRTLAARPSTRVEKRAKLSMEKIRKDSISPDEEAVRALVSTKRPFAEKRSKMAMEKSMKREKMSLKKVMRRKNMARERSRKR